MLCHGINGTDMGYESTSCEDGAAAAVCRRRGWRPDVVPSLSQEYSVYLNPVSGETDDKDPTRGDQDEIRTKAQQGLKFRRRTPYPLSYTSIPSSALFPLVLVSR